MDAPKVTARPLHDQVLVKVMDPQVGSFSPTTIGSLFGMQQLRFKMGDDGKPLTNEDGSPQFEEPQKPEPSRGIIVSVGPGFAWVSEEERKYVPMDVKVGDDVLFFEEHGLKIKVDGEELVLLRERYLLIVLSSMDGQPAVLPEADA